MPAEVPDVGVADGGRVGATAAVANADEDVGAAAVAVTNKDAVAVAVADRVVVADENTTAV